MMRGAAEYPFPIHIQFTSVDVHLTRNEQGNLSHEVISGAAAFEGFKLFENHQRREGAFISSPHGAVFPQGRMSDSG